MLVALGLVAVLAGWSWHAALWAEIAGERGIAPVASSGDLEVNDIAVNTTGANPTAARDAGRRAAIRAAWARLWAKQGPGGAAPALSDGTLDGLVAGFVIGNEALGPHRYIATLTVRFDRARTGAYLGMHTTVAHSPPLLVVPVLEEGGSAAVFEYRTPWQRAWAEFRAGESAVTYVRAEGSGADGLLLDAGQTGRRSRTWWHLVLDQFGAADVLIPVARLERSFPGGPVTGLFVLRYGPDRRLLDQFALSVASDDQVPAMLAQAVRRCDALYGAALADGRLELDRSLNATPRIDPKALAGVLDQLAPVAAKPAGNTAPAAPTTASTALVVQIVTPDPAAVDAGLSALRATPGVASASISSVALGGASVVRVSFNGDINALAAALRAGGWRVTVGNGALLIRR